MQQLQHLHPDRRSKSLENIDILFGINDQKIAAHGVCCIDFDALQTIVYHEFGSNQPGATDRWI